MLGKKSRGRRIQISHDFIVNSNYATLKQTAAERMTRIHNCGISSTCSVAEDWRETERIVTNNYNSIKIKNKLRISKQKIRLSL